MLDGRWDGCPDCGSRYVESDWAPVIGLRSVRADACGECGMRVVVDCMPNGVWLWRPEFLHDLDRVMSRMPDAEPYIAYTSDWKSPDRSRRRARPHHGERSVRRTHDVNSWNHA